MSQPYEGDFSTQNIAGIIGRNTAGGDGVFGSGTSGGRGVVGVSDSHIGVEGNSNTGIGIYGTSQANHPGVEGHGPMAGVYGESANRGVLGVSASGDGVFGQATTGRGVVAVSESHVGVDAFCRTGTSVFGNTETGIGVHGKGGRLAGFFQGDVEVTGDIRLLNADCAEDFDVVVAESERIEPGTVMVIKHESTLRPSQQAYDKRVAGVISGAGNCRPGIVLDKQAARENRMPLALMGKVYCKVDAQYAPIEVGDLLTTSPTPGHAMKADDPFKAFGSVIGKALRPLEAGQGLIPILIALQ